MVISFTSDNELREAIHNFYGSSIELFKNNRTRIREKMRLGVEAPVSALEHYLDAVRYRRIFRDTHELPDLSDLNLDKQRLISEGKAEYDNDIRRNAAKTPTAAIEMAHRLAAEGLSQPKISEALAAAGYLSVTGRPYHQARISLWGVRRPPVEKKPRVPKEPPGEKKPKGRKKTSVVIIEMARRLAAEGLSQQKISEALAAAGYLSAVGKPFKQSIISRWGVRK
jgi:hypothetical protein